MAQLLVRRLSRWRSHPPRVRFDTTSATAAAKEEESVAAQALKEHKQQKQQQDPGKKARSYLPGATVATLAMVAVLHGKRLYEDKQMELAIQKGIEPEFSPDTKASFLQLLPLRFISRVWGSITSTNLPGWSRSFVYKAWARAFHTDLDEVPLPLEEYPSLRDFFVRGLKEGARPLDSCEKCLLSPVDGIIMRFGRVTRPNFEVEQVKGFTYSLTGLLGSEPRVIRDPFPKPPPKKPSRSIFNFWRSQPPVDKPVQPSPPRDLFYCVLYLGPGDYHRVHSPSNWSVEKRRHFSGNLFPVNARAARTIKNLYVVNERVVLEGDWQEGFMAMALVGATNIGSIELKFEPELKTNVDSLTEVSVKDNCGLCLKRGAEFATFNMGSTVVMVFEAPGAVEDIFKVLDNPYQGFQFTVKKGQRIKMGQTIGEY